MAGKKNPLLSINIKNDKSSDECIFTFVSSVHPHPLYPENYFFKLITYSIIFNFIFIQTFRNKFFYIEQVKFLFPLFYN